MDNIDKIISENINKLLLEKENYNTNKILYHQTSFSIDKFRLILKNGLIPNDNGESNCVWFSVNKPFYNDNPSILTFKVQLDDDFKNKHKLIDDISRVMVLDVIKPYELEIEDCPFCIDSDDFKVLFSIKQKPNEKLVKFRGFNSIAEYIVNNKQLKERNLIIFSDIFDKYVEKDTLSYFKDSENIQLLKLI